MTFTQVDLLLDAFGEIEYNKSKWSASLSGGKLRGEPYRRSHPPGKQTQKEVEQEVYQEDWQKDLADRYFGRKIVAVTIKLFVDPKAASRGLKQAERQFKKSSKNIDQSISKIRSGLLLTTAALGGLTLALKGVTNAASDIEDLTIQFESTHRLGRSSEKDHPGTP